MRPVLHGDVMRVALLLYDMPETARPAAVQRIIAQADAADRYRKRIGRSHPLWGNGSLMSAAGPVARDEPYLDDARYCHCLALVFDMLVAWRSRAVSPHWPHN